MAALWFLDLEQRVISSCQDVKAVHCQSTDSPRRSHRAAGTGSCLWAPKPLPSHRCHWSSWHLWVWGLGSSGSQPGLAPPLLGGTGTSCGTLGGQGFTGRVWEEANSGSSSSQRMSVFKIFFQVTFWINAPVQTSAFISGLWKYYCDLLIYLYINGFWVCQREESHIMHILYYKTIWAFPACYEWASCGPSRGLHPTVNEEPSLDG